MDLPMIIHRVEDKERIAFRDTRLTPSAVNLIAHLATYADGEEVSVGEISERTGQSRSEIKNSLLWLGRYWHVERTGPRHRPDGTVVMDLKVRAPIDDAQS